MTRFPAAIILALILAGSSFPAFAADRAVKLTLDGRPVDRAGGVALVRNGVVYADVVALVKSFDGLLTFQGNAVVVSIGNSGGTFTVGGALFCGTLATTVAIRSSTRFEMELHDPVLGRTIRHAYSVHEQPEAL